MIDKIKYKPMSASELNNHGVDTKFLTYDELSNYNNVNELFEDSDYVIILIRWDNNTGHYIGLINDNDYIEKFDSFGLGHTYHKELINNKHLNPEKLLDDLLKTTNKKIIKNRVEYQNYDDDNLATCGRHILYRFLNHKKKNMNLKDYNKLMKKLKRESGLDYDEIVSYMIS